MNRPGTIWRTLALLGTIAIWLPFALMLATSAAGSVQAGAFWMDVLIPAELFPLVIAGGALLLLAARRAGRRQRLIAWGLGLAVGALILSQGLAVVTGLASGAREPAGWPLALVAAGLVVYTGAAIALGVGGVLSLRDLCGRDRGGPPPTPPRA